MDEYEDLEEIAELLACGTQEDWKEDYIRPFCEKFFFDLLNHKGASISLIEQEFLTYCAGFMHDIRSFLSGDARNVPSSPTLFCPLLNLAYKYYGRFL